MDVRFAAAIDHDGGEYGVMLGVRGTILESDVITLPGPGEARVALIAEVAPAEEDSRWTVCCTHLSTDGSVAADQLGHVLSVLEDTAGSAPAALVGDLNMGPERVLPMLHGRGWIDAPTGPTHPSVRPRRRIDWIAVRGAEVAAAAVPALAVSDHRPVLAVVEASVDADRSDSLP